MTRSLTQLLIVLIAVTAVVAVVACAHLASARDGALAAERDLGVCQADLRDLADWHVTVRTGTDPTGDDPELNRRVRQAATAAGLADQLASIEPGPSVRVADSDTLRTPIYLRLDGVTLRQVVAFTHELTSHEGAMRATGVELSAPVMPAQTSTASDTQGELWTADLTLSESSIAAKP